MFWSLIFAAFGFQATAEDAKKAFSFYWENDVFTGTDRDYSNGLKLAWSKPYAASADEEKTFTDKMIARLPLVNAPDSRRTTFFAFGQNVYTPEDTKTSELIVDDRPYAGYLYMSVGIHADRNNRRHVWEFETGVVGPMSLAHAAQDFVHDTIDTSRGAGWEHQLDNELTIGVGHETKWRLWQIHRGDAFGVEFIPHLGGRFGNVDIYANAGIEFRFGWHLPNNFGTCPIRPGCDVGSESPINGKPRKKEGLGVHFFVALDGRAVLHNIFLDGNTFTESHSVDKEPFVSDFMSGVALQFKSLEVSYAYYQRSREFKAQNSDHAFGAIKITYLY